MNMFCVFSGWISKTRLVCHFFLLFCSTVVCCGTVTAYADSQITFSWRANPADDYVIGYRLYFGGESRFVGGSSLKNDFKYASFLDFAASERCDNTVSGLVCNVFQPEEVECDNLYGEVPQCTLFNLQGDLYFAMTAYNAQAESDYTYELKAAFSEEDKSGTSPDAGGASPEILGVLQQVYTLLIYQKEEEQ